MEFNTWDEKKTTQTTIYEKHTTGIEKNRNQFSLFAGFLLFLYKTSVTEIK